MRLSKTLLAVALIALLGATVQAESSQSQDMGIFTAAQFTSSTFLSTPVSLYLSPPLVLLRPRTLLPHSDAANLLSGRTF